MELPEYYLTRSEAEILSVYKDEIFRCIGTEKLNVVELGAGDGKKTKILLSHLIDRRVDFSYIPVDISEEAVRDLSAKLKRKLPELEMHGLVAEYFSGITWLSCNGGCRNLVLFLGSNIGNFSAREAEEFLTTLRESLNEGDYLLIGFDLKKDVDVLQRAYNDREGVTAAFNLNLLARINRELGGDFKKDKFMFYSTWDPVAGAIQSYLLSTEEQIVHIAKPDFSVDLGKWEPIHTESSHKFSVGDITALARRSGFQVIRNFRDSRNFFVDSIWQVNGNAVR
jgi:dimethylhistidine N-methyltransferase